MSHSAEFLECLEMAYRLLARREQSRFEISQKLRKKTSCQSIDLDDLLEQLVDENVQSDERFVEMTVRSGLNKGHGPVKIRYKLREHHINHDLISKHLDDPSIDWDELIHEVRCKKYGDVKLQDFKEKARQSRFLASRGFTSEMINKELKL